MYEKNLNTLLDALTDTSVYVIEEETHKLLYFNQRCEDTGHGCARLGRKCSEVWPRMCADCPIEAMGEKDSSHILRFDPELHSMVDMTASRILWDGHIRAVVLTSRPHSLNYKEEQGLDHVIRMYEQSLVTVFRECIIANLSADYYVNCQKDMLWTDIPQQGNFGSENRRYASKTIHPQDLDLFLDSYSREAMLRIFGEGKKQIVKRMRRLTEDGTYHMVEFAATKIEDLSLEECWCVLVFRDIDEEYRQEMKQRMEIIQLATAARIAFEMLISVNLTKNTYRMLEYDRFQTKKAARSGCFDELIEVGASTVDPDFREEFVRKFSRSSLLDAFARGERVVSMEMRQMGDDGIYHWNSTQAIWVDSPDTEDVLEVTLSKCIDKERQQQEENLEKERTSKALLEDALEKAKSANRAKSDFLSRMSHDIRTPMNAVLGMTELAQMHMDDQEKLKDYLSKIESSGRHLLGLINEVLDVSKIESGKAQLEETAFDLHGLIEGAVSMVLPTLQKKKQTLTVEIGKDVHTQVQSDQQKLRQVLVNILDNASKYTKEGGVIRISLKDLDKEEFQAGTYQFVIEDNGIGMTKEYQERIFEPFSRADDVRAGGVTGTGLGMTIVLDILNMLDGKIDVESEPAKGTRFIVTVRLARNRRFPILDTQTEVPDQTGFYGLRVLVAGDNELNRQIAGEMLALLGVEAEMAPDGFAALEAVRTHPPYYYDMIFMDIQMPVLNGYEAARQIRGLCMEHIEELPIVAMTADAFTEDVKQARLAGMCAHIAKPISMEQLRRALSSCVRWKKYNDRN